jgi:Holliday junction DNA helicase RuvA
MYDHLFGEVVEKSSARAVLRCAGVGFECRIPLSTASVLQPGSQQQLFTLLHVVDGMPSLLGFATRGERELARKVMSVSGIGPAIALALLSVYEPAELATAIAQGDATALRRVKGIGQKTAERLCLELREAMQKFDPGTTDGKGRTPPSQVADDAIAALVTLGFAEKDARDKVEKARSKLTGGDTEALVKAVLQM